MKDLNYFLFVPVKDIVEGFCRLMVSLGENHSKILITECTGNGQEAVAEYMKIVVVSMFQCQYSSLNVRETMNFRSDWGWRK